MLKMKLPEGQRGGTDGLALHVSRQGEEQEVVLSLFTFCGLSLSGPRAGTAQETISTCPLLEKSLCSTVFDLHSSSNIIQGPQALSECPLFWP